MQRTRNASAKAKSCTRSDRLYLWISKHYLALLNLIVFVYVGLPFAAPVFMKLDAACRGGRNLQDLWPTLPSVWVSLVLPLRRAAVLSAARGRADQRAVVSTDHGLRRRRRSVQPLQARARREFVGDTTVGFKVALCERDVAIYGSDRRVWPRLRADRAAGCPSCTGCSGFCLRWLPIGLDGFSQLFSQFNWPWLHQFLPYRESTPMLRVLTGFLFGFGTAWFAYPNIEDSMRETRQFLIKKFAVVGAGQ